MIKKNTRLTKQHPPVKLYLEDIINLIDIFDINFDNVNVELGDYELSNKEDLLKVNKDTQYKNLRISGRKTGCYVYLELNEVNAEVSTSSDDVFAMGIFSKLNKYIEDNNKRFNVVSFNEKLVNILNILTVIAFMALLLKTNDIALSISIGVLLMILVNLFTWNIHSYAIKNYSLLSLYNRVEDIGFFKRNKDQLIIAIFASLIGAITGVIGTLLITIK